MSTSLKEFIEKKFRFKVSTIGLIGEGYDSKAYLVNNEYIFKQKFSENQQKSYRKEKAILDFLRRNMRSKINIPKIDYFYADDDVSVMGYKKLEGRFLTPSLYRAMSEEEQKQLKIDIANFLKEMHGLGYHKIKDYIIDNKKNCWDEYNILKSSIYNRLENVEKNYIKDFYTRLEETTVFDDKKCLCHNDFSCNHLLVNENNKLTGIIDFGDAGIVDEYADFVYLLEDSEEEIGREFGLDILKIYNEIDKDFVDGIDEEKTKEYQELVEQYYPIETMIYGIRNNRMDYIEKGRQLINPRKVYYIYGASGAGSTTLGKALCEKLDGCLLDTDDYFWKYYNEPEKQINELYMDLVSSTKNTIVITGSFWNWNTDYSRLLNCIDVFVRVMLNPTTRIQRLEQRELERYGDRILEGGDLHEKHRNFIEWAKSYDFEGIGARSLKSNLYYEEQYNINPIVVDSTNDVEHNVGLIMNHNEKNI